MLIYEANMNTGVAEHRRCGPKHGNNWVRLSPKGLDRRRVAG